MSFRDTAVARDCNECSRAYIPTQSRQKYCGDVCSRRARSRWAGTLKVVDERACAHCATLFTPVGSRHRWCSKQCASAANIAATMIANGRAVAVPPSTRGAISELRAAADLMERGFHVFRAMSSSCPCDLVAWKEGILVRVEVKTAIVSSWSGAVRFQTPPDRNVFDVVCHVSPEGIVYEPPIDGW